MADHSPHHNKTEAGWINPNNLSKFVRAEGRPDLLEKVGAYLLCLPETIGWYSNRVYTGHTLKRKDTGWLLIVRATLRGKREVCFSSGQTPAECVRFFAVQIYYGQMSWRDDLY